MSEFEITLEDIQAGNYTPITTDMDFRVLKGEDYDHVPEIPVSFPTFYSSDTEVDYGANDRVEIETLALWGMDALRAWALRVVKFDGARVMVIQNGGRSMGDWASSHIFDRDLYLEMCQYLLTLCSYRLETEVNREEGSLPIEPSSNLYEFHGYNAKLGDRI